MSYINNKFPIIIEPHSQDYNGYPFVTLLLYGEQELLTLIDNHDKHSINAFVLDFCDLENVNEEDILELAHNWYYNNIRYPISIDFHKNNHLNASKIYKSFNINYIKRVIGPLPKYNMDISKKIKRKKRKVSDITIPCEFNPLSVWAD